MAKRTKHTASPFKLTSDGLINDPAELRKQMLQLMELLEAVIVAMYQGEQLPQDFLAQIHLMLSTWRPLLSSEYRFRFLSQAKNGGVGDGPPLPHEGGTTDEQATTDHNQ